MEIIPILVVAALVFGVCRLVDKSFAKAFRSKAQHLSGMAVRANKQYGVFGVILIILGILAVFVGISDSWLLMAGGIIVLVMGVCLAVYYLSFGIFYDGESFLYSSFGKKSVTYFYKDITEQKLYLVQGGSVIVELHMADGTAVSVQSGMDGVYPFLDTAFAGWCLQMGRDPQTCDFYDPANHWWFPHEEEA
ncbi:MAG: hypothetical protein IJ001_05765 [Oscillospiraceae bacterium]|nr:hypothetical protein [Oscillospiraceae bacterium]